MKTKLSIAVILLSLAFHSEAQLNKAFSKLKNKVKADILGDSSGQAGKNVEGAGECACEDANTVFIFSGNMELNYTETEVCLTDDGKVLLRNMGDYEPEYYISDKGKVTGPYKDDNPVLAQFECFGFDNFELYYSEYISKKDYKYLITFKGKEYGPYAQIEKFVVSRSKQKFAAIVVKDSYTFGIDMEELESQMQDASQEEQMAMAMEMTKKMQQQLEAGEEMDVMPKLVTNISNINWDPMNGIELNTNVKFDDICLTQYDKITDLNGETVFTLTDDMSVYGDSFWLSKDNKRYAWFDYGTLSFSDGNKCFNVFSPGIIEEDGIEYIRYMFFSPDDDAIKMCKLPL